MVSQYKHGGEVYNKEITLDYSINVNPFGMPEAVKQAVLAHMDDYAKYPDDTCTALREAIATSYDGKITKEMCICGNGAAEVIYRLCLAVKPKQALLLAPTFSEYERALRMVSCDVSYYDLKVEEGFEVKEDILTKIRELVEQQSVVFLCNPNNPVGNLIDPSIMKEIIECCKERKILLVVDECFMEFTMFEESHSVVPYLRHNEMVFVLKAFTKTYAMAGLRLGYGLSGNAALLLAMEESGPPWMVSTVAQVAGVAALTQTDYVKKARALLRKEREYLAKELQALGFITYHSETNYILFESRKQDDLYERMIKQTILIRQCANYRGLGPNYYRICIGKREENVKLIEGLKKAME